LTSPTPPLILLHELTATAKEASRQMKVLCVIDNLSTGGAQRQISNLAVGLRRRGHDIAMFCYAPGALLSGRPEQEGVPIHCHLKPSRFSLNVITGLKRFIDQEKFQAVVSYMTTPNFYALMAVRHSTVRPAVIVSERFGDIPGFVHLLDRAVYQLYRLSDEIVVNSHHQRENFLRRYRWCKDRITTVYNGYDLDEFAPSGEEPDGPELAILVIASVSRYKNGLCLVQALDILRREHGLRPRVSWVGERVMRGDHGRYARTMDTEIDRAGLSGQWHWLGQRKDVVPLLHGHDVLVHPSYGEGLPNAVCEAMACGRPVIVSNTLDHPKLVENGRSGLLFDWRDPADLARKIKAFSNLPRDERRRMGLMGRAYAENNLSIERYVSDFEAVLSRAVI
jgi:GalNAc-alpha-(1->4)-GalNAc-alpha-(1->3)-diNAcBac-PP-undecaprenol alpha-1,4-N-acetyl-D-galactosaminyltransferase